MIEDVVFELGAPTYPSPLPGREMVYAADRPYGAIGDVGGGFALQRRYRLTLEFDARGVLESVDLAGEFFTEAILHWSIEEVPPERARILLAWVKNGVSTRAELLRRLGGPSEKNPRGTLVSG